MEESLRWMHRGRYHRWEILKYLDNRLRHDFSGYQVGVYNVLVQYRFDASLDASYINLDIAC